MRRPDGRFRFRASAARAGQGGRQRLSVPTAPAWPRRDGSRESDDPGLGPRPQAGLVTLEGAAPNAGAITSVAFSPDGKRLVSAAPPEIDGSTIKDSRRSIEIWDLAPQGRRDHQSSSLPALWAARPSARTGNSLAARPHEGSRLVRCEDAATGQEAFSCGTATEGMCGRGLQPGRQASGRLRTRKGIRIWDVDQPLRRRPPGRPIPRRPAWPSARTANAWRREARGTVELWDTATGQKGPDLQGALRTRPRDRIQPGRHAAGHGGRRRHPAPLGRDRTADADCSHQPEERTFGGDHWITETPGLSVRTARPFWTGFANGRRMASSCGTPREAGMRVRPDRAPHGPWIRHAWTARTANASTSRTRARPSASWTPRPARCVRTFPVDAEPIAYYVALSPDEKWFAHAGADGTIRVPATSRAGAQSPARSGDCGR